jgi:hypothetical protein
LPPSLPSTVYHLKPPHPPTFKKHNHGKSRHPGGSRNRLPNSQFSLPPRRTGTLMAQRNENEMVLKAGGLSGRGWRGRGERGVQAGEMMWRFGQTMLCSSF